MSFRKKNNNARALGIAQVSVAKDRGSFKRESSQYEIEKRFTKLETDIRKLAADIKAINDKIVIVQKVTRDKNGKETIIVKQS
tara:strand:+ start:27439 stop:27687 length:249 start_codon:yes stop_codon:yes gene_type:complete